MNILFLFFVTLNVITVRPALGNTDLLPQAKSRWVDGDPLGVISLLEPWTNSKSPPYGNERDALRLLLAEAYIKEESWGLASRQLGIVRSNNKTLAKYAALREPWIKFKAKEYWGTKKRCESIRKNFPNSDEAIDCLKLIGMTHGELGHISSSRSFFDQYLAAVPNSPYRESLQLLQAEYTYRKVPKEGTKLLYTLFFHHQYPTTDVRVQEIMGEPFLITTLDERLYRIYSFIRGNRLDEAWKLFDEIRQLSEPTPSEAAWVVNHTRDISWRTRQFEAYLELVEAVYSKEKTSENAYRIFRAYCKAGMWEEASTFGEESLDYFGRVGRWSGARDEISRAMMFANKYDKAAILWGKQRGKAPKFYKGFSLYMAGQYDEAIKHLTPLANSKNAWDAASNYWMGRAIEQSDQDPSEYYAKAKLLDSSGWYDLLVDQRELESLIKATDDSEALGKVENKSNEKNNLKHKGQWNTDRQVHLDTPPKLPLIGSQTANSIYSQEPTKHTFSWNNFTTPSPTKILSATQIWPQRYTFPDPYKHEVLGDNAMLEEAFQWVINNHSRAFSNLRETQLLVKMGLYPEAARNMQSNYHLWEKGRKGESTPSINSSMQAINFNSEMWRNLFLYTHTHHYVLRYTTNMERYFDEPVSIQQVKQINHPLVRPADMWMITEQYNVDPWLILGLMRQESAYRETVRSWVGAIGYIQVMPATGAKLAFLLEDSSYSPTDLEDPETNLRYGIFYFSKLMERFDNAYPLAVGSYNGGPHNMSRWYKTRMGTWEMDEFVEHIPYDETRRYIKKVTGHYARYVNLYLPTHQVVIPKAPLKDDQSVINF